MRRTNPGRHHLTKPQILAVCERQACSTALQKEALAKEDVRTVSTLISPCFKKLRSKRTGSAEAGCVSIARSLCV